MALFQKKQCPVCGKPMPALASSYAIRGGRICEDCWAQCSPLVQLQDLTSQDVLKHISLRCEQPDWAEATDTVSKYIAVDRKRQIWYVPSVCVEGDEDIFRFSQLVSFDLMENGGSVTQGGLGTALAGGALFGATGAIVGGGLGKKQNDVCRQLSMMVVVDDPYISNFSIDFLKGEFRKNSDIYKSALNNAHKVAALLTMIQKQNEKPATHQTAAQSSSAADEILKYKNLMDMGAITQEEYDAKKKQLLGL